MSVNFDAAYELAMHPAAKRPTPTPLPAFDGPTLAFDSRILYNVEHTMVKAGEYSRVDTGVEIKMSFHLYGEMLGIEDITKKGLTLIPTCVAPEFDVPLIVTLRNPSSNDVHLRPYEKIALLAIHVVADFFEPPTLF